jgi:hypothetical protein
MRGVWAIVLWSTFSMGASDYAGECETVIGVPIPDVDCDDPGGSEVPVGVQAGGQCDTPSHGLSGCNPGTRFIRYTDTITRAGRTEVITTFFMCRKTGSDRAGDGVYSDIGVIQYNETKHASCWFSSTKTGQRPTKRVVKDGVERLVYPSPTTEDRTNEFWGRQPQSNCLTCHQNGVWLRSPFAMAVQPTVGKGYKRAGGQGEYTQANGNHIPENHEEVAKMGMPCSIGKPTWNGPMGSDAPRQVKISANAYDRKFPRPVNSVADSSGSCTRCHTIGVGVGSMQCSTFLSEFRTGKHSLGRPERSFASRFWMPPGHSIDNQRDYTAKYGRALDAVAWCCEPGNLADADYGPICGDRFTASGERGKILQALNGPGGSCALCPDCFPKAPSRARPGVRGHE